MNLISTKDKQPEKEGAYLVFYNGVFPEITIGFYRIELYRIEHGSGWDNNKFSTFEITHWMPLPEPPTNGKR